MSGVLRARTGTPATSSLTEQVTEQVTEAVREAVREAAREAIHTGEPRPGELYAVYRPAEQLDVSRTHVREAMLRLA
ncbi:hypothetical protein [Microbispora bryophytorum]|uniref:hypothetical protein n=1 Tax=Microbispora bryophytorum TaxID=1460882 RepID=UPI0033CD9032